MAGPTLAGKITLDDSQAAAALARLQKVGAATAAQMSGAFKNQLASLASPLAALAPAIAAAFAGKNIISGVTGIFEAGRALSQLSRSTGASVAGLAILQAKFKAAGLDSEQVGTSIFRLQKSIAGVEDDENKGGTGKLRELGLDLAALQHLAPDRQLFSVGRAISAIKDPAERTATAMQIFGRAGGQLGAVFNGPGFGQVSDALAAKARMMAQNAAIFEQVSIKLDRVGNIAKTFYAGVADKVGRSLLPVLDRLEKINLVSMGQQFGEVVAKGLDLAVGLFSNPKAAFGASMNYLAAGMAAADNVYLAGLTYAGNVLRSTWVGLGAAAENLVGGFSDGLLAGTLKLGGALTDQAGNLALGMTAALAFAGDHGAEQMGDKLKRVAVSFGQWMLDALTPTSFKIGKLIGTSVVDALGGVAGATVNDYVKAKAGGREFHLGASLTKAGDNLLAQAGGKLLEAGRVLQKAVTEPKFQIKDVFGAGRFFSVANGLSAQFRPGAGNLPSTDVASQVRVGPRFEQIKMALANSHVNTAGKTADELAQLGSAYVFQRPEIFQPRMNATDPYTARIDAMRHANWSAAHTFGATALDYDPSARPGWTGAKNAFSNGMSVAPFRNGTSLSTGGLGGGAYGGTGNIWTQISGYSRGKQQQDPTERIAGHVSTIKDDIKALRKCWEDTGGSGGGGGGATTTN